MEDRFLVSEIYICPVNREGDKFFKPDTSYPTRYCVIDEKQEIVVDIKTKLKYDYVKTMSHLYFINKSYEKIRENKRVAILPFVSIGREYDLKSANEIIENLKNGVEYKDGNEVYGNKEYLEYLKKEALKEQKFSTKVKKIIKRKK